MILKKIKIDIFLAFDNKLVLLAEVPTAEKLLVVLTLEKCRFEVWTDGICTLRTSF